MESDKFQELVLKHFNELAEGLNKLQSEVGGFKTDMGGVKTDIGGLRADMGEVKTDIGGLKIDMWEVTRKIDGIMEQTAGLLEYRTESLERMQTVENSVDLLIGKTFRLERDVREFKKVK